MKNILVPTDFSQSAHDAFEYALHFADKINGQLTLMHVHPAIQSFDVPNTYLLYSDEEKWDAKARERYEELKKEIEEKGINVPTLLETKMGELIPEILNKDKNEEADWIIMGTHGNKGIWKLVFGSNAASVATYSKAPVVVVPEGYQSEGTYHMVFAVDYTDTNPELLRQAAELAQCFEAKLTLLHVAWDAAPQFEAQKFQWYEEMIRQDLTYENLSFELLQHPNLQVALRDYVKLNEVDMLIMAAKKRNFFQRLFNPSETREMAFQTEVPLLVLHETAVTAST